MKGKFTEVQKIFFEFLLLGCHSFGGPLAHMGYFQREFVQRKRLLSNEEFGGLMALCHFLPGPSSSQLGMAIGYRRAGVAGSIAAFIGFTLPSAVLMFAAALWLVAAPRSVWLAGVIHGLKVFAVAVVMDALWQMAGKLSRGYQRAAISAGVALLSILWPSMWTQMLLLLLAALCGLLLLTKSALNPPDPEACLGWHTWGWLLAFALLLAFSLSGTGGLVIELFRSFFRAGALVFGGGHVVLPLLDQQPVVQQLSTEEFLLGYSLAQAVPGPMFTLATYLGAVIGVQDGKALTGGLVATLAIFLPGWLLLMGTLPAWQRLRAQPRAAAAIAGVSAAAVGLLLATLIGTVWPAAMRTVGDYFLLAGILVGLNWLRLPVWLMVLVAAAAGAFQVLITL